MLWIVEKLFRIIFFENLTTIHKEDPMGDAFGKAHFVADDDHRHSVLGQADHDIEHLFDHFRIKGRGRFVKEHGIWFHAQAPGNSHPLLLST